MTRLRLAITVFRCALLHKIQNRRGWLRCTTCRPIRQRRKPTQGER